MQTTNSNRKSILILVFSVITLLALLISITYSWFFAGTEVEVDYINPNVRRSPNLSIGEIKEDGIIDWNSTLQFDVMNLSPICGNGVNFFTRVLGDYTDLVDEGENFELYRKSIDSYRQLSNLDGYCYSEEFYIRWTGKANLYISLDSTLTPDFNLSRLSEYIPGVSTGYIAGALRIAILEKNIDDNYELKCVWIPNPKYEYNMESNSFNENGTIESEYYFMNDSNGNKKVVTTTDAGYIVDDGVLYIWDLSLCNCPFSVYDGQDFIQYKIIIWLEGTDRECVNALAGGNVNLKFGINAGVE